MAKRPCRAYMLAQNEDGGRMGSLIRAGVACGVAALLAAGTARAQGTDPDWPCVQRLVPALAAGQMWQGETPATADDSLAPLAGALADPSRPLDALAPEVKGELDAAAPEARQAQAGRLFGAVLERVNAARGREIEGIKRFARSQRGLAERITARARELGPVTVDPALPAELDPDQAALAWDRRLFEERQRSVRTLCDQPVQLEQRAYAVARLLSGTGS